MKKLWILLCLMWIGSFVNADTINFKDGRSISGKILEKTDQSVKIDLNGLTMTYFADEIKDVDGQALGVAPTVVPVVKAPTPVNIPATVNIGSDSNPEDPVKKRVLILKFIDVFGTRRAMTQSLEGLLSALATQRSEDAQKIRQKFRVDEVIEKLIPLYDKHFTSDDLKAYIDFYSSPQGQKLLLSIGVIMKESITVGADYLREKFPEMDRK